MSTANPFVGLTRTPMYDARGNMVRAWVLAFQAIGAALSATNTITGVVKSVKDFGAKGDAVEYTDGVMAAGTLTLTSASNPFARSDVGKIIFVVAACTNGGVPSTLEGTIATVNSIGSVTMTVDTTTAARGIKAAVLPGVTGATFVFGTDDTAAIQEGIQASAGCTLYFPSDTGGYLVRPADQTVAVPASLTISDVSGICLLGDGSMTHIYHRGAYGVHTATVVRGHCIAIGYGGVALDAITIRNLYIHGDGNGNLHGVGGGSVPGTGAGWDISHKGIIADPDHEAITNLTIDNVHLEKFQGELIYGGGAGNTGWLIQNSTINDSSGDGVSISCGGLTVINCEIYNVFQAIENGIWDTAIYQNFFNNKIHDIDTAAITLATVTNNATSIHIKIQGNEITRINNATPAAGSAGVQIHPQSGSTGLPSNIDIIGNSFTDCSTGIYLVGGDTIKIHANHFIIDAYPNLFHIDLSNGAADLTNIDIAGNTFTKTAQAQALGRVGNVIRIMSGFGADTYRFVHFHDNIGINTGNTGATKSIGVSAYMQAGNAAALANLGNQAVAFYRNQWLDFWETRSPYNLALNAGLYPVGAGSSILALGDVMMLSVPGGAPATAVTINTSKIQDGHEVRLLNIGAFSITFSPNADLDLPGDLVLSPSGDALWKFNALLGKWSLLSSNAPVAAVLPNVGTPGAQSPVVTTDAQGRVVSSAALAAANIPAALNATTLKKIGAPASAVSVAAGAGAGTSPTVTLQAGSNDVFGSLFVVTGTTPTANATLATITFGTAYAAGFLFLTPASTLAPGADVFSGGATSTAVISVGTALTAAQSYVWNYIVLGA